MSAKETDNKLIDQNRKGKSSLAFSGNKEKYKIHENWKEDIMNTFTNLQSAAGTKIYYFDESDTNVTLSDAQWDNMSAKSNKNHVSYRIQEVDDMIRTIRMLQWMNQIPETVQKELNINLNNDRNGYLLDYTENMIVPYVYLPMKQRKKHRWIWTILTKWILEDAEKKLSYTGGIKKIMDNRSHGEETNQFDHNTNLDCVNREIRQWERDIDKLIKSAPLGKIITRLWREPKEVFIRIWHNGCEHMIIRYEKIAK